MRGYFEDGGLHTVKVFSYNPNNFGFSVWLEMYRNGVNLRMTNLVMSLCMIWNPEYRYDVKNGIRQ